MPDDFREGTVFSWRQKILGKNIWFGTMKPIYVMILEIIKTRTRRKKRTILSFSKNNCDIFTIFKVAQYHAFDIYLMINNVATYVSRISSLITFCVNGL